MIEALKRFGNSSVVALRCTSMLLFAIWLAALANYLIAYELNFHGILPREINSLPGIIFWPFLHGGFVHLAMNTTPLFILGFLVGLRGPKLFLLLSLFIVIVAGLAVWVFGRTAYHIGASGLVFGYFGFLVAVAWYEKHLSTFLIAALVLFFYGGLIFGVLPRDAFVSFEAHLFGLIAGMIGASLFARKKSRLH